MTSNKVEILECTLRDGSYAIDFQFTPRDTALIAAALENAGLKFIEIGHGLGLNASKKGKGVAAANDEEYMQAAANTLNQAHWGMFFIPGIGRYEDLKLATDYGMDFIRIGTNVNEVEQSKGYIEHARKLGMFVSANLMKSYALPPKELSKQARLSEKYGAEMVYLVDSAGTMLPGDIKEYVSTMRDTLEVPIGLHCHDNLSMGMANILEAIDYGVQRIDSTLQGMGRGGGNPATEILVTVLKKRGIDPAVNLNRLMNVSEKLIKPMLQEKGLNPINITSGYAGFHSGYLNMILKYAKTYNVDTHDLIIEVCLADQITVKEETVKEIALRLKEQETGNAHLRIINLPQFEFTDTDDTKKIDRSLTGVIKKVVEECRTAAKKRGKLSVLNIVTALKAGKGITVSRFVQEEFDFVIGSLEVDSTLSLDEITATADGIVDIILVDSELKPYLDEPLYTRVRSLIKQSTVIGYKDSDTWVRSVDHEIRILLKDVFGRNVTICGTDSLTLKLTLSMIEQGARITLTSAGYNHLNTLSDSLKKIALSVNHLNIEPDSVKASHNADIIASFSRDKNVITRPMVEAMAHNGIVFDGGIGSVSLEAITYCNGHEIQIIRPDMRAVLACDLASSLGTYRTVKKLMGRSEIAGVPVVAGGLVGKYGDIVVDSVSNPSRVVGVADGKGTVMYDTPEHFSINYEKVKQAVLYKQAFSDEGTCES